MTTTKGRNRATTAPAAALAAFLAAFLAAPPPACAQSTPPALRPAAAPGTQGGTQGGAQGGAGSATPGPATPGPGVAADGTVVFGSRADAPEVALARRVFSGFLAQVPEARVEAAMIDLDGDGTAEVAVRFVSPRTCSAGDRCTTMVIRHDRATGAWDTVFERRAATLRIGSTPERDVALMANGSEVWVRTPGGPGVFVATLRGRGREVWMTEPVPSAVAAAARAALVPRGAAPLPVTAAVTGIQFEAGPGMRAWAVTTAAMGCGSDLGCPFVVLVQEPRGGSLRAAYAGVSDAQLVVLPESVRGMNDLGVPEPGGWRIARWNGTAWADAETSYASPATRAP